MGEKVGIARVVEAIGNVVWPTKELKVPVVTGDHKVRSFSIDLL